MFYQINNFLSNSKFSSFETENGIYAEEQAVVGMKHSPNAGTSGKGFYQYIGDDDRIYRVEYTVGEQGYQPKVRHLNYYLLI